MPWGEPENGIKHCYATMVALNGDEIVVVVPFATPEDGNQWLMKSQDDPDAVVHVEQERIEIFDTTHIDTDSGREVHDMRRTRYGRDVPASHILRFSA